MHRKRGVRTTMYFNQQILAIILMGFLSAIFGCSKREVPSQQRFVSESDFRENLANQSKMTPQTIAELRKLGVAADAKLKLEFFFYTNQEGKAAALSQKLRERSCSVEYRPSAHDANEFLVTGWTTPITISESAVTKWEDEMCRLGFECDCDFDGWGTNPKQ